ncbi:hypothetical protein [Pseudoalteromonas piscicida]|uniref:hypothetical protein n=1 Tax=Pseudoalteromonas piscicida TaxID=43662 RepID=UPI0030A32193
MKYTVIGIGKDYKVFPYLAKLSSILKRNGDFSYACWDRRDIDYNVEESEVILKFSPSNKPLLLLGYITWWFKVFWFALRSASEDNILFASRFDAGSAVALASLFNKSVKFVYLDRDAFHMTYNFGPFQSLVKRLEYMVAKRSVKHFVPGRSRDFTQLDNVCVIENTPTKLFLDEAKSLNVTHHNDDKFVVYVNGWLVSTRGADMILKTVKLLDPAKFQVIVAGPSECDAISELISLEIVEYLGQLSNVHALSYYFISDVVLCFYDPSIDVNRKAEPNKWFDCAFTGTPFITNKGIVTFEAFKGKGPVYAIEYGIASELFDLLNELCLNKTDSKYRPYFEALNVDYWDVKVERIIKKLN